MPDSSTDRISSMSTREKVGSAMRRSLPLLPEDARQTVLAMLEPTSLAIIGGTLAVWAGSHFFGVGELADAILLGVGVIAMGFSVFDGARELADFAREAIGAKSASDLDSAGAHFAAAVTILGVATVQTVLLRSPARTVLERGVPRVYPRIRVPPPPASGSGLQVLRPARLPKGNLGDTDAYGRIRISRDQSIASQRETLYHELVHRYFSPKARPLRHLRAELRMSAYQRSALLRYLEERLAEGYTKLKTEGFTGAKLAWRFPIENGYVTVSELRAEGYAVGSILLGGKLFYVTISVGPIPSDDQ